MPVLIKHAAPRPKKLPRLSAWWDFSDVASQKFSGSTVSAVTDKSGQGNNLTYVAGTSTAGLSAVAGRDLAAIDGLWLSGVSPWLGFTTPLTVSSGDLMISYAAMGSAASNNNGFPQRVIQSASTNWLVGPWQGNINFYGNSSFLTAQVEPYDVWFVHTAVISAAQSSFFHWFNGALLGTSGMQSYPGQMAIGAAGVWNETPLVKLGEIIVSQYYDEQARQSAERYLMGKWGAGSAQAIKRPSTRRVFFATAAAGVTVSLTQQAGIGTIGTIAASRAVTLAQQAGTGTVGTLTAGRAATLAQQTATGTLGTPSASRSVGVAQVSATGNVGTVTAVIGATAALSQVAATGNVGAVVASTSIGLTQTAAAGTIGSIAPSRAAALTQTAGTGTVGTATPGASIGLAQQAGTGTVGSIAATAGSNVTVSLTQQSATGAVGIITASVPVTVSLSQVAAAGTIGAMAPSRSVGVTQAAGTGAVGTITAVSGAVTVSLSQVTGTGTVGSLAWARSLGLGHVIGTGAVGTLTPGGAFIPSTRRTLTLTASARTIAASRLSRTIIIP